MTPKPNRERANPLNHSDTQICVPPAASGNTLVSDALGIGSDRTADERLVAKGSESGVPPRHGVPVSRRDAVEQTIQHGTPREAALRFARLQQGWIERIMYDTHT